MDKSTPSHSLYDNLIDHFRGLVFHNILVKCAKKLNYTESGDGLCHGFTMRWIEAVLSNTTHQFLERTIEIKKLNTLLDDDENNLEGIDLWDIMAFYESLFLYQDSELSSDILRTALSQHNIEEISAIAASDPIMNQGGLKHIKPIQYGHFESLDIATLLEELERHIIESGYEKPIPFILTLLNAKGDLHSTSLFFNPQHQTWQWMDVNHFPPKDECPLDTLIDQIDFNEYQYFSISAILPKQENTAYLESKLSQIPRIQPYAEDLEPILYLAADNNHLHVIKHLLQNKSIDLNKPMGDGSTSLFIATCNNHHQIVQTLLSDKRINPNLTTENGFTPLYVAAREGYSNVVDALLNREDINPNITTVNGGTPLHIATLQGHLHIVQKLLKIEGIDPNIVTTNGYTPLHIAAGFGHLDIVIALLRLKAIEPNQTAVDKRSPLFLAAQNGHLEIVQEFLKHPKVDMLRPVQFTEATLKTILNDLTPNLTQADFQIRGRMLSHIIQYQEKHPQSTLIEMTPQQIALIMGHRAISEAFSNLQHNIAPSKRMKL